MHPVTVRGEKIEIREIGSSDVDALAGVIGAPDVLRYTTWKGPADREAAAAFVRTAQESARAEPRTEYLLAIVSIDSGEVVGTGGIRIEDASAGAGSLRCLLHPDWWSRGIGTEATKLLESAGLRQIEVRPQHHLAPDGERRDSVAYAISREEWSP